MIPDVTPGFVVAALRADWERKAKDAEVVGATAPVASVYRQCSRELADMFGDHEDLAKAEAVQIVRAARHETPDRLLRAADVAERLGIAKRTVYANAHAWPFTRRLGRSLRFSEAGLTKWLEHLKRNDHAI